MTALVKATDVVLAVLVAVLAGVQFALGAIEFLLGLTGMAALYRFVPNAPVRWSHAFIGASLASIGIELAKRVLGFHVPGFGVLLALGIA
mgnify:CR=1 FL=1